MKLTEVCTKKPVFATVLSLIIILFGILGFMNLHTRYFPNIDAHMIFIETSYAGASSHVVENMVTNKIENDLQDISGIDKITSDSSEGQSEIKIKFDLGVNFLEKANEVRDALASARQDLPSNADAPLMYVRNDNPDIIDLFFANPTWSTTKIQNYLKRFVKNKIQTVPGIGDVEIFGGNSYAMRIWLNPAKMAARKITIDEVTEALQDNNLELPAGHFKSLTMNFPINADSHLKSAAEFNDIAVKTINGKAIHLRDIGKAVLGHEESQFSYHFDKHPGVGIVIHAESSANPISISKAVRALFPSIVKELPPGMSGKISWDSSKLFEYSLHEVYLAISIAILCVALIILLFLGKFRSALIPIATIPICVVGAFAVASACGFTINVMTLLAIVLSVGLVVDDAIVMLENIHRYMESGLKPLPAAIKGGKQIASAIIAMSLTLAAVYLPLGFMHQRTAIIFREFAFTLAGTVLISGFVSLTLTPAMCAKFLTANKRSKGFGANYTAKLENLFIWCKEHYAKLLSHCLKHRIIILIATACVIALGITVSTSMSQEFIPNEDSSIIFVWTGTPDGSNLAHLQNKMDVIEKIGRQVPEMKDSMTFSGFGSMNNGMFKITLTPPGKRHRSAEQIANSLNAKFKKLSGLETYAFVPNFLSYNTGYGIEINLLTTGTYASLYQTAQNLNKRLKNYKGLTDVGSSLNYDSHQYNITINRNLANSLGISAKTIDEALETLLGGLHKTDFFKGNQSYRVILQSKALQSPDVLKHFYLSSPVQKIVPLSSLITIKPVLEAMSLSHYNRLRSTEIHARLANGYSLKQVVRYLNSNLSKWLPNDTQFEFKGAAKHMLETKSDMALIFILALSFIYLILAAQFESFIDPFIILFTVPFSVVGALITLKCIGGTLNIYTDIGFVTLVGLITKHGILITKFANELRKDGLAKIEAIIKAASIRLRPILMTTAAMILGTMPLVLTSGYGSNSHSQIGWVIMGGLFFGTFFSLILVPVVYSLVKK